MRFYQYRRLLYDVIGQSSYVLSSLKPESLICSDRCYTWLFQTPKVLAAESKCLEDAIRCGGLAPTKASCIKNILSLLLQKRGKLCLEYLRNLSMDEIKSELSNFKGIGPKTVISGSGNHYYFLIKNNSWT